MSITVAGPTFINAASSSQAQVDSFGELKACAARVIDGEDQPAILSEAGRGIRRGILDINMRHLFDFGSEVQTDVNLTSGTAAYALQTDFYVMRSVQLINSDGDVHATLQKIDWDRFNALLSKQGDSGVPTSYSAQSAFSDATISLYPVPDASAATDYDLRIVHYKRISRPSADTDVIAAPQELSDVLCTYGEYHVLFWRNDPRWQQKYNEYRDKLQMFRQMRERVGDDDLGWMVRYDTDGRYQTDDPLSYPYQ